MQRFGFMVALSLMCGVAMAAAPGDPKAVSNEDGKYVDANGDPTFNVEAGWYGRLVYVLRLSPLPLGLPCLPRARGYGFVICTGTCGHAQDN